MGILPDSHRGARAPLQKNRVPLPVRFVRETGRPFRDDLIRYGLTWWEDFPSRLQRQVSQATAAGRVEVVLGQRRLPVTRDHLPLAGVVVRRLKKDPPRWRKPVLISLAIAAVLVVLLIAVYAVAMAVWAERAILTTALVALALVAMALRVMLGHRPTCSGLHCPGCRG